MNVRSSDPNARTDRPRRPGPPRAKPVNIQDGFLFESLKESRVLAFALINGKAIKGKIRRFDQYALQVESESQDILIYKHAIVGITETTPSSHAAPSGTTLTGPSVDRTVAVAVKRTPPATARKRRSR